MAQHAPVPSSSNHARGFVFGLASALAFGLMGFMARVSRDQLPAEELAFFRAFVSVVVLLPFCAKRVPSLFTRNAWKLWLRSLSGSVSVVCYFSNLHAASVADATALRDMAPLFVILLSWAVLKQRLHQREFLGVALVLVGAMILRSPVGSHLSPEVFLTGLTGAFAAGVAYLALREASRQYSATFVVWAFSAFASVATALAPGAAWVVPRNLGLLQACAVGVFGLLGQIWLTRSFSHLSASVASVIMLSGVVWGAACEGIFLGWRPTTGALVSYAIILGGVTVLYLNRGGQAGRGVRVLSKAEAEV